MGSGWPPCAPINPPTCLTEIKRCTCVYADDGEQHSLGDVTRPSVDSAFSLPPSRSQPPCADQPLPVPARLRDDDRSTKPRIWSLAEVATSSDHRPKRSDRDAASAEFRPWMTAETATWKLTEAKLGAWQAAFVSAGNLSTTPSIRWHRNNADKSVSSHVAD